MASKTTVNGPAALTQQDESAAARYIAELKATHGRYARPADEARRLVDESMGSSSLTELLYKAREDRPA